MVLIYDFACEKSTVSFAAGFPRRRNFEFEKMEDGRTEEREQTQGEDRTAGNHTLCISPLADTPTSVNETWVHYDTTTPVHHYTIAALRNSLT